MKKISEFIWPLIGLAAVVVSGYFLYQELRTTSLQAVWSAILAIPPHRILLAAASTLVAYAALAWYDRIALLHLGVSHISWLFVSLCSFTTYALSHNIGASVFSGALVRYRAYTAKGLSAAQVAVLVALCSFTFFLGTILLGGFTLVVDPTLLSRLEGKLPGFLTDPKTALVVGIGLLAFASHAPGGLGVFEIVFITAMNITDEAQKDAIIAAVIIFRIFYFWLPALVSVIVVVAFERSRLAAAIGSAARGPGPPGGAPVAIMSRMRAPRVSTTKGLVSTAMPGSRCPLPITAFSA